MFRVSSTLRLTSATCTELCKQVVNGDVSGTSTYRLDEGICTGRASWCEMNRSGLSVILLHSAGTAIRFVS